MCLVLCKLVHSGEVASLGTIVFFKTRFSRGSMAVTVTGRASGSLCWRFSWMSLGSCAERLLAHCEERLCWNASCVVIWALCIHVWFPGDVGPHRHPCSRFVAESVERIFGTSLPCSVFNLDGDWGVLLISDVVLIDIFRLFVAKLSFSPLNPP